LEKIERGRKRKFEEKEVEGKNRESSREGESKEFIISKVRE
jgi:hypothetical protein